jgi:transposase-like protein
MPVSDIPALREFWPIIETEESGMNFLTRNGIVLLPEICEYCSGRMSINRLQARCTTKSCRRKVSCLKDGFFSKSRLPVHDTLLLAYLWLTGDSYSSALAKTTHSTHTIVDYYSYFRQLVADSLNDEDWTIGGEDIIIEIDESKFGKRKHNRGKRIEGAWVIGGIERTAERKFFVQVVENRNRETIIDVLSKHILPGSIVHTDCWKGYIGIDEQLPIEHRTVNHKEGFVDGDTGVHTNTIEGKWAGLKRRITLRGRVKETLPDYLFEQIWRKRNENRLWAAFVAALKDVYYE